MSPCKTDTPTFVDNKGGDKRYERVLVFIYIYHIVAETNITFKQQYIFKFYKYTFKQHQAQATKYFEVQATSMTSCRCKYNAQYNL